MRKARKILISIATLCFVTSMGVAFNAFNEVNVQAELADSAKLAIQEGASIRMNTVKDENDEVTGYDTGIRFTAKADATLVAQLVTDGAYNAGAELGMFIVPEKYINAYNAQKEEGIADYFTYFSEVKGMNKADYTYVCSADELTGATKYNVSIVELREENYNLSYQAVAYYALDNVYYYTNVSDARTVSYIANAALLDEETPYSDAQRTALGNIIERAVQLKTNANGAGENATHVISLHGEKTVNMKYRFANEITDPELTFDVTAGSDAVVVEEGVASALKYGETATVNVKAYDGVVDFDVTVKTFEIQENEIIDFATAHDLELTNVTNEENVTSIEFVEEFQGAQGVLKVTANNWGRWGFDPLQNLSAYEGYDYIVVRTWVETSATDAFVYIKELDVKSLTNVVSGRWLSYYFDADVFLAQWADLGSYYSAMATNRAGTYYIDKIYATNEKEVIDFTHSTDTKSAVNAGGVSFSYEEEFQGAQGVLKVNIPNSDWCCLKFKAIMGGSNGYTYDNYAGSKYLVIRMYATNACSFQIANSNGTPKTNLITNKWTDLYFDANAFMSQWADTGNYYSSLIFKSAGTYYIDKIYMTDDVPEQLMMLDFYNETTKSYLTSGGWDITATQYYSEFQGAQGVMAITGSGGYALQCFKIMESTALLDNYTHFVIRAYADTASDSSYIRLDYNGTVQQPVEKGVWKDYIFTIDEFKNFLNSASYKGLRFGAAGTYYIDCMYVTNL